MGRAAALPAATSTAQQPTSTTALYCLLLWKIDDDDGVRRRKKMPDERGWVGPGWPPWRLTARCLFSSGGVPPLPTTTLALSLCCRCRQAGHHLCPSFLAACLLLLLPCPLFLASSSLAISACTCSAILFDASLAIAARCASSRLVYPFGSVGSVSTAALKVSTSSWMSPSPLSVTSFASLKNDCRWNPFSHLGVLFSLYSSRGPGAYWPPAYDRLSNSHTLSPRALYTSGPHV